MICFSSSLWLLLQESKLEILEENLINSKIESTQEEKPCYIVEWRQWKA